MFIRRIFKNKNFKNQFPKNFHTFLFAVYQLPTGLLAAVMNYSLQSR